MSATEKIKILKDILGDCSKTGSEFLFRCPEPSCNSSRRKLSVNMQKNMFKCWVCGWAGRSLYSVVKRHGLDSHKNRWRKHETNVDISLFASELFPGEESLCAITQKISLPEEFVSLTNKDIPRNLKIPLNYLTHNRGITREDIIRWKIGVCATGEDYSRRIVIPSFGLSGDTNYFVARTYVDDFMKYKNPNVSKNIIFNHLFVDWDEPIRLVEGVFDAIKAGPNSIPILGSSLKENSLLFSELVRNECKIYIALDPDARKKQSELINSLLSYDMEVYDVKISSGDVGNMTRVEYRELEKSSERIDFSNRFEFNLYNQLEELGL